MCWNAAVSLQTFLFAIGCSAILIAMGAVPMGVIAFAMSVSIMQLNEYFLWTHLENPMINNRMSVIGLLILAVQPIFAIGLIKSSRVRVRMWAAYLVFLAIVAAIYGRALLDAKTVLSERGHLKWLWLERGKAREPIGRAVSAIWIGFVCAALILSGNYWLFAIGLGALMITNLIYAKDGSWTSHWCIWINVFWLWMLGSVIVKYL